MLCPSGCRTVTDAALCHLSSLTALRDLRLSSTDLQCGAWFAQLAYLTSLALYSVPCVNDASLVHVGKLISLVQLGLGLCQAQSALSDAVLVRLGTLSRLRSLHLGRCRSMSRAGLLSLTERVSWSARVDVSFHDGQHPGPC